MAKTDLFIAGEGYSQIETLQIPVGIEKTPGEWEATGRIVYFHNTSDVSDGASLAPYLAMFEEAYGKDGRFEGTMPEIRASESVDIKDFSARSDSDTELTISVSKRTTPFYVAAPHDSRYDFLTFKDESFKSENIPTGISIFGRQGEFEYAKIDYLNGDSSSGILTIE